MKNVVENIKRVRMFLKHNSLDAFIIPSGDRHFGEYIQDYFACREWVSGFSGSAGTVVITQKSAGLWTDSRYFIQAQQELEGSGILLMKMRIPGTPSITEWLKDELAADAVIGMDASLISKSESEQLQKELASLKVHFTDDPFNTLWTDRPPLKFYPARGVEVKISGRETKDKLHDVCKKLSVKEKFIYILSTCDDIAWLCNIRGTDIPFNPLVISYAVFTNEKVWLFTGEGAIDAALAQTLEDNGVTVMEYGKFDEFLSKFDNSYTRVAPADKISVMVYKAAVARGAKFMADTIRGGVVGSLKAVKNETEIAGFRDSMLKDGVAWVRFWKYLEESIDSGNSVTEVELAHKIAHFRALDKNYMGESFSQIVAYGANAAMPHYSPFGGTGTKVERCGFLLVDTGGQYINGTTDTTRTFALGALTPEQIEDYTLVLKGMITLSMAKFIKGTRGASLDILARGPIFSAGKLYSHGTGHGIGHNLCVHEGPQSIRMEENPVALEPGMVISNEPAIYEEGFYGIRIENTILCKRWKENKFGEFYDFETLTLVPVDTKAIDKELLGEEALQWLNSYHNTVYNALSPLLNKEERIWLADKTLNLN